VRGEGADAEVYLVLRSRHLRFFGGYWALPGGVVDDADRVGAEEDDARRCALRELFEETGILLGDLGAGLAPEQRDSVRADLLERGGSRAGWDAMLEDDPGAADALATALRITTPEFAPVRYRTLFFRAELPAGEEPTILPGELEEGAWWRPAEALEAWRRGELLLAPPTLLLVELLDESRGAGREFLARSLAFGDQLEAGRLHPVRHSPGVFAAPLKTPTLPPATTTNTLLVGAERVYVVDPAPYDERERERLVAGIEEAERGGARLEAVLLTHHHRDHVGAVELVARRFALPVRGHALTLERVAGDFERGAPIADGDALELGRAPDGTEGWLLRAYHTPGHDRGHLCFREERYGALIVGDMVSTLSTILVEPPEGDLADYLASLERLRALPSGMLYPAHGIAARDSHAVIDRYLEHRRWREERLVSALGDEPRADEELLDAVYADVERPQRALGLGNLRAGLLKLAAEGRAREAAAGWSGVPRS
jgi:glyoxylase-like metal-dependent hydrolase (beta-lactamase superfamily II)/8-oxo-dGTP pyrophosphatase MutT (NUDIX family)